MKNIQSIVSEIHALSEKYIQGLEDHALPVNHRLSPQELKQEVSLSLPKAGKGLESLKTMATTYLKYAVRSGSTRYYNQLFSGFNLPGYVGELLTAITNTSMYTYEVSPLATLIERELIQKMCEHVGFNQGEGTFVTGGSNANLVSLFAAIHRHFPHVKNEGWRGDEKPVFFVSDQSHYSFSKAALLLGIGLQSMVKVKAIQHQMDTESLAQAIKNAKSEGKTPFYVGATAGTTVFGSFDPFEKIHAICQKEKLWFHVDGAWGGSVILSSTHKELLRGVEKADSYTWDAHKMMGLPLICSVILFNQEHVLAPLNDISGIEYLFHDNENANFDLGQLSLQCGRRVDALKLWLAWQCYGDEGWSKKIDKLFELTQFSKREVEKRDHLTLIAEPVSLNLCFQYIPTGWSDQEQINAFNIEIRERLGHSGKALVNYSSQDGQTFIRLILVNFDLNRDHLIVFFDDLENVAKDILTEKSG